LARQKPNGGAKCKFFCFFLHHLRAFGTPKFKKYFFFYNYVRVCYEYGRNLPVIFFSFL